MATNTFQIASGLYDAASEQNDKYVRKMTLEQFTETLQKAGAEQLDQTSTLFNLLDMDEEGVVDMQQLIAGLFSLAPVERAQKAELAFNVLDTNGDGFLTQKELDSGIAKIFNAALRFSDESAIVDALSIHFPTLEIVQPELVSSPLKVCEAAADAVREIFASEEIEGKIDLEHWLQYSQEHEAIAALLSFFV
eukprot:TRINITY_DN3230_c0_g1_i2.p1 TRINITY_DN3230_c0_g1~~TRINITY_DN3230_c0_g1_i2.p1  ORF type:complete len:193 (+),score=42.10 TRINITY_DN3230_c0_g1_i2:35-613(+)